MILPRMSCTEVLAAAGLSEHHERFATTWSDTELDGDFLTAPAISATCTDLGMSQANHEMLVAGLALFDHHPALRVLAAQVLRRCITRSDAARNPWTFPALSRELHPAASLFYAYVVLGGFVDSCAWNLQRGIPVATTRAVFADLERWLDEYARSKGHPGFDRLGWLWLHLQGRLHELGRLQFECTAWAAPVRAFRHRHTRSVALLMLAGEDLRSDGRHQGIAGSPRDPVGFTTTCEESPAGWRGHRVNTAGVAEPTLSDLHIPAGGGLTPAACAASCQQALAFFPRHFPERSFGAIVSTSWMFDPQLAAMLPADSNLVRFQRAFHLHPHRDLQGRQIRERVLGHADADWRTYTPTTSLQRAVVTHLQQGGLWCQHGAILFPDEVAAAFTA
jgi:hypothetical protein